MSKTNFSDFLRRWATRNRRAKSAVTPSRPKARLGVELFEDRVVPATTVPAVNVTETRAIADGVQAQLAVDPTNPLKMVAVAAAIGGVPNQPFTGLGGAVTGRYSLDGGANWADFDASNAFGWVPNQSGGSANGGPQDFRDPLTTIAYTDASSPSVVYSRGGDVYVSFLLTNAAKTSGVLAVASFDFSGLTPVALNRPYIVYRWVGQDPALNPVIGLDNNVTDYDPSTAPRDPFIDPDTGLAGGAPTTMADKPALKGGGTQSPIYVAWNTNATQGTFPAPFSGTQSNIILIAESSDRGRNFTTPVYVTDRNYFAGTRGASPQIYFSPTGGVMTVAWSSIPPVAPDPNINSGVVMDRSQPDGGVLANQVGASTENYFSLGNAIPDATIPPPPPPGFPPLPHVPGRVDIPLNTNLLSGSLRATDTITDLNFGLGIVEPDMNQVQAVLTAPDGSWITLFRNQLDGFGVTIVGGTPILNKARGLDPGANLGVLAATTWNAGTFFDDEAPRPINDPSNSPAGSYTYPVQAEAVVSGADPFDPAVVGPGYPSSPPPAPGLTTTPGSGPQVFSLRGLYAGRNAGVYNAVSNPLGLSGQWVLTVFDTRNTRGTNAGNFDAQARRVTFADIRASGMIQNVPFGSSATAFGGDAFADFTTVASAPDQTYPLGRNGVSPTLGVGPMVSYAYDKSLGSFSPFSGRLYAVYTDGLRFPGDTNSNARIAWSDANGAPGTWQGFIRINNDSAADNFTEGNRYQFMPTVTVDPTTGMVVAMWYDARFDAANSRVAQYMAVSTDGGLTWSAQTPISMPKTAVDAITGQTINLEPIPGNLANANAGMAGQYGFGTRQGLSAYGGKVTAVWTANLNSGATQMFSATIKTAAGPRIIGSDMGTVNSPVQTAAVDPITLLPTTVTYNNRFTADGYRIIDGFTITYDRPIDSSTFSPADIAVLFRDPNTPLSSPGSIISVQAVTPLDNTITYPGPNPPRQPNNATRFFVRFTTPQTAVGTYSYSVSPNVRDRIRNYLPQASALFPDVSLIAPTDPNDPSGRTLLPRPFTGPLTKSYAAPEYLPVPDLGQTTSTINIPQFPAGAAVGKVRVQIQSLTFPRLSDLDIALVHTDAITGLTTSVQLANSSVTAPPGTLSGANLSNTLFADASDGGAPLSTGTAPYTGTFAPVGSLAAFTGSDGTGNWNLVFTDRVTGKVGTINAWRLFLFPNNGTPVVVANTTFVQPVPDLPIPGPVPSFNAISDIVVPDVNAALPAGASPIVVGDVIVDLNLAHANDSDLTVDLVHTDSSGVTKAVRLVNQRGGTGDGFLGTRFDDNATQGIQYQNGARNAPFTGTWRAEEGVGAYAGDPPTWTRPPLGTSALNFFKGTDPAGTWSLYIRDVGGQNVGVLQNWSLTILPGQLNTARDPGRGNYVDQNANSRTLEYDNPIEANTRLPGQTPAFTNSDMYSVPAPVGGVPFTAPYASNTLPLSETGPYVLRTAVAGQVARVTNTVTPLVGSRQLLVTFDRPVDPATFTPSDVIRISDPNGNNLNVNFTITPAYPGQPNTTLPDTPTKTFLLDWGNSGPITVGGNYVVTIDDQVFASDNVALNSGSNKIVVTFSRMIDSNSFTPADVFGITGPNGTVALPAGSVTVQPINPVTQQVLAAGAATTEFLVTFPGQFLPGGYSVQFGPDINSTNQPQWTQILAAGTNKVTITFDAPLNNVQGLNPADMLQVYGPTGQLARTDYTLNATSATTYDLTFITPITAATAGQYLFDFGVYSVTVPSTTTVIPLDFVNPVNLTDDDVRAVSGPNGAIRPEPNGKFRVQQVAPFDGRNWQIIVADQIDLVSPSNTIPAGVYSVYFNKFTDRTGTVLVASNTLDITFPDPKPAGAVTAATIARVFDATGRDTVLPTSVAPVGAADANGNYSTFRLTFPDTDPAVPGVQPLAAGSYTVRFTAASPFAVTLPSQTGTVTTAQAGSSGANAFDITFPSPLASLPLSSISRVLNAAGVPVLGPTSVSPVGTAPTKTWRLTFPDQNPATTLNDGLPAGTYTVVFTTGAKLDINWNAGLDVLKGGSPTNGTFKTITHEANGPIQIPPVGSAELPINFPESFAIQNDAAQQIQLVFTVNYPDVRNIDIDLVAPDGSTVRLYTGSLLINTPPSNKLANFTNTTLTDTATTQILNGLPDFNPGPFTPQFPLTTALAGKGMNGVWKLRVTNNNASAGSGQIINWKLTLPYVESTNGLGETYADRFTAGFKVFTLDPTNPQSQQVWSPLGGSPTNPNGAQNSGQASAIAVDPSDPSGNTVYAGGATGGIWKTTNFLTQDGNGPTWIPLLDQSLPFALNIGSIAVVPQNGDTNQSIIFALTGNGNDPSVAPGIAQIPGSSASPGIGVLRSKDGGKTWQILDSTTNVDGNGTILPFVNPTNPPPGTPLRDHAFNRAIGFRLVADPQLSPTKQVVLYMAMSTLPGEPDGGAGIWRSVDGGDRWFRLQPGQATDVALSYGSAGSNGNLLVLYGALRDSNLARGGVYFTPQAPGAAAGMARRDGGIGTGVVVQRVGNVQEQVPVAVGPAPGDVGGRITLATVPLTGNPLNDSFFSGWVYAVVSNPNGTLDDLYQSKDFGLNWTPVKIPEYSPAFKAAYGTNNETRPIHDLLLKQEPSLAVNPRSGPPGVGNSSLSLATDPNNPNIVYIGGLGAGDDVSQPGGGVIRVDLTKVNGSETFVFRDESSATPGGAVVEGLTNGGVTGNGVLFLPKSTIPYTYVRTDRTVDATDFLNLARDPSNPFGVNSTLLVGGLDPGLIGDGITADVFTNNGENASWRPFTQFIQTPTGAPLATGIHQLYSFVDPLTGKTRLIAAADQGIYTGVDRGDGQLSNGVGFLPSISRSRNGNIQLGQYFAGAVQPSQSAADIAGAMFYAMSRDNGFPVSTADILKTGNTAYSGDLFDLGRIDQTRSIISPEYRPGSGTGVAVDPTGSGSSYQYRQPAALGMDDPVNDFFRYYDPSSDPTGSGISRIGQSGQLVRGNGADVPFDNVGQWPIRNYNIGRFAVNTIDPNAVVLGSNEGRVYRTTDAGLNWFLIGDNTVINASPVRAVAFGSPDPNVNPGQVNNLVYAGKLNGTVWVTATGGGTNWVNITDNIPATDGPILQIVTDPKPGSRTVFVITASRVYYKFDGLDRATPQWVDITGDLFTLTRPAFQSSNPLDQVQALRSLATIAADWRFAIRIDEANNKSPTRPEIYVGGDGGVFRLKSLVPGSPNALAAWEYYPTGAKVVDPFNPTDRSKDATVPAGGLLPDVLVTDLDLSTGNVDRATGLSGGKDGLNLLVATTFGRGQWAIRLDPTDVPLPFVSGPKVSAIINPFPANSTSTNRLLVQFDGPVDPTTFTAADFRLVSPTGVVVPITGVNLVSQTPQGGANPNNLFEVNFAPQTIQGLYSLTVGASPDNTPRISDAGGNLMNQDGDRLNGEKIVDQYSTAVYFNGQSVNNLVITGLTTTVTAGDITRLTITAKDQNGNTITTYNGTVTITSSDPAALFDGNTNPPFNGTAVQPWQVTLTSGVGQFDLQWRTAGQRNVAVTPPDLTQINPGGAVTTVLAGAATSLSLAPPTITTVAGATLSYTLTARDAFGNVSGSADGQAAIGAGPGRNTMPTTAVLVDGMASFSGEFFDKGTQTITATANGLTATATALVNAAAVDRLIVTLSSTSYVVGSSPPITVTVTARDAFDNLASPGSPVTLSLVLPDPTATITPSTGTFVNGVATFQVTFGLAGSYTIVATTGGVSQAAGPVNVTVPPPPAPPVPPALTSTLSSRFAVGSGLGGSTEARVYNPDGSPATTGNGASFAVTPFPAGFEGQVFQTSVGFTGDIRTASGDVNGDGVEDLIVGSGATIVATVLVIDGKTGQTVFEFHPFEQFTGGTFVAVGDVNGDGIADIVITPDRGGGPRVTILAGAKDNNFPLMANFFGIRDPEFRGGARAGVGDVNGDGFGDVIVSAGFTGGPRVSLWDGKLLSKALYGNLIGDFFVFEPQLRNGAFVALSDVNGDGYADLIAGAGEGGGPRVRVLSGKSMMSVGGTNAVNLADFFAGNPNRRGGTRVAAKNLDGDRYGDFLVGDGLGDGSLVQAYYGLTLTNGGRAAAFSIDAFPGLNNGVYVG